MPRGSDAGVNAPPIALLVAVTALGPAALHIVVPSLPGLAADFETDAATAQLALTAYLVAIAVAQLVYGPLSDRYGRRPVLLAGLVAFLAGTLLCGAAPSIGWLVAGRFVQGFGGCAGMVIGRAIVRDVYGRERSASVIAFITMAMALAPAFAPALGGWIEVLFGWRAEFILLGATGAPILALTWLLLAETNWRRAPSSLAALVAGHGELLRSRAFLGYAGSTACSTASWYGFVAGAPHLLVVEMGRAPTAYGQYILLPMLGYIAGNFLASRISERLGVDRMLLLGIALSLAASVVLVLWSSAAPGPLALFLPMMVVALGNGLSQPNGIAAAISVRPPIAGTASGLMGFLQMILSAAATMLVGVAQDAAPFALVVIVAATTLMALAAARYARRRG